MIDTSVCSGKKQNLILLLVQIIMLDASAFSGKKS